MELNLRAFALAFGLWWGLGVFVMTWGLIMSGGPAMGTVEMMTYFYIGYELTPLGSVIGLIWGVVCGTICGAILAWLYNRLLRKFA